MYILRLAWGYSAKVLAGSRKGSMCKDNCCWNWQVGTHKLEEHNPGCPLTSTCRPSYH